MKIKPFIKTAETWMMQSTCCRVQVGAVIFNSKQRLLSIGYNGVPSGMYHCNELFDKYNNFIQSLVFDLLDLDRPDNRKWIEVDDQEFRDIHHKFSERYEVHAEQNALLNLIKTNTAIDNDTYILTTTEPCQTCCKLIVASGIKHVLYIDKYDNNTFDTEEYFSQCGVDIKQVNKDDCEIM